MKENTIILGIDPGSRITGYGLIEIAGKTPRFISCGTVPCKDSDLATRLHKIQRTLCELIQEFKPNEAAVEQVFTLINPQSALKLGQARGAALSAIGQYALPCFEYSAKQVKRAVVGYGGASKQQIQLMIKSLLKLNQSPSADAADALAIALCHIHTQQWHDRLSV